MGISRQSRLKQILDLLCEHPLASYTKDQIAERLGIANSSYLQSLLTTLIKEGKVYSQRDFKSPKHVYSPCISNAQDFKEARASTPMYQRSIDWHFDDSHCFLCGISLTENNRTVEHVVPKWLQKKYKLHNQEMRLLNGTFIKYQKLTIPCCKTCNGVYLARLERRIQLAHDSGINAFRKLPPYMVYQWGAKIFYGLLYRELSLYLDRSNPALGKIFTPEELENYSLLHWFLQSIRLPFIFRGFLPWSLFIVRTLDFPDQRNFDYTDSYQHMVFSIRMGEIGLILCLEDGAFQQYEGKEFYEEMNMLSLHPLQFLELVAKAIYYSILQKRTPTFTGAPYPSRTNIPTQVICTGHPRIGQWDDVAYALVLAQVWERYGIPPNDIFHDGGSISLLWDKDGQLLQFDQEMKVVSRYPRNSRI